MILHKYNNYDEYVAVQREANERKRNSVWAQPEVIQAIALRKPDAMSVLCHGVRTGKELDMFAELLPGTNIMGTEIGEVSRPDVMQHDFHEPVSPWESAWDIVYSNSLDHAYDPYRAITTWLSQLAQDGLLVIEWAERVAGKRGYHAKRSNPSDPLSGSYTDIVDIITTCGGYVTDSHPITHAKSDKAYLIYARRDTWSLSAA